MRKELEEKKMGICPNAYYNYRKDRKVEYREQKQLKNKILELLYSSTFTYPYFAFILIKI